MSNSEQLYCKLSNRSGPVESYPLFRENFQEILNIGMLGSLYLRAFSGTELQSCASLRFVYLHSCKRLNKLGNYPRLHALSLIFCDEIKLIGKMCQLSSFSVNYRNVQMLSVLPLERLEEIYLDSSSHELVLDNLSRFRRLKSLTLRCDRFISTAVHFNIPSLTSLVLRGFHVVDSTGLNRLTALDVTTADTVIGKEVVYPQLGSLSGNNETFIKEATAILSSGNNKLERFSSRFL
jgi:hypothetical protein